MNPRERMLASSIGILMLFLAGFFVYRQLSASVQRRNNTISVLQRDREEQEKVLQQGDQAEQELKALRQRSLPKDRETARSLYSKWLLDLVDRVGLLGPTVRSTERGARGRFYDQLTFQVDAEASLEQLVEFLHEFYSTGDLHRIQQLTLQPIMDSQNLDVIIWIDGLILPDSERQAVGDLASSRIQDETLKELRQVILERSMFLPANIPPKLASISEQEAPRGETFSLKADASDPDELQQLSYQLIGDAPQGAELNENTGQLSWTPTENGAYDFTLQVTDNGTPRLSDEARFQIVVVDPPPKQPDEPEKPRFDEADSTYLVGTILDGDAKQLWLMVRTTGQLRKLNVGDSVSIGSVSGTVLRIAEKEADIHTDDGDLRIRVGQNLAEAKRLDDTAQKDLPSGEISDG